MGSASQVVLIHYVIDSSSIYLFFTQNVVPILKYLLLVYVNRIYHSQFSVLQGVINVPKINSAKVVFGDSRAGKYDLFKLWRGDVSEYW